MEIIDTEGNILKSVWKNLKIAIQYIQCKTDPTRRQTNDKKNMYGWQAKF